MEEINEDWTLLIQYLKLYAKLQAVQTASLLALLIGLISMYACEIEECACIAVLGSCGLCIMGIPTVVVMVSAPDSAAELAARLLVYSPTV